VKQRISSRFDLRQTSAKAPTHQRRRTVLVPFFADVIAGSNSARFRRALRVSSPSSGVARAKGAELALVTEGSHAHSCVFCGGWIGFARATVR
jgi:hypothetical protein